MLPLYRSESKNKKKYLLKVIEVSRTYLGTISQSIIIIVDIVHLLHSYTFALSRLFTSNFNGNSNCYGQEDEIDHRDSLASCS